MLIAEQGFDGMFKGIEDAADGIAGAFAVLFALAALAALVMTIIVTVVLFVPAMMVWRTPTVFELG